MGVLGRNGLRLYGMMNSTGPRFFGWKKNSNIWCVDGIDGLDSNNGKDPDHAFQLISKAVSTINAFDTVFIMDKSYSGTDPDPYQETSATNHTIAIAKKNVSFIGCPICIENPATLQIKGDGTATTPVFYVYAPMTNFENLGFNRGGSTQGAIYFTDEGDTTDLAMFGTVYNCHFKNMRGSAAAATSVGGGIVIDGGWNYTIKKCTFADCRCGIYVKSSAASTVKWLRIDDCEFSGTVTNRDVDIYMTGTCLETIIKRCVFADQPAYASAGNRAEYLSLAGAGVLADCSFGMANAGTFGAAGDAATIVTAFFITNCHGECAAATVAGYSEIGRT